MITTGTARTTIVRREELWWEKSFPNVSISGTAGIWYFFPSRIRIIDENGKKKIVYNPDSFWGIPPIRKNLGNVRSDKLDDFLYGSGDE